jgi:hypothetical protein
MNTGNDISVSHMRHKEREFHIWARYLSAIETSAAVV